MNTKIAMKEYGLIVRIYLCALFLWGMGWLAILPPFEGFDENSHYSNIREIASSGELPVYGVTMLDSLVIDYAKNAPMAYGTMTAPFDTNMNYYRFFQNPDLIANYITIYCNTPVPPDYKEGDTISWEAIHAPLYYLLLAPLEKITHSLPLVSEVFLLRLASFLLVIAAAALSIRNSGSSGFYGFLVYPLLFPAFFSEFGRIGNDSLCILITAALSIAASNYGKSTSSFMPSLLIGLTLAIGLLSKAFFIPITAAVLSWIFVAFFCKGPNRKQHFLTMGTIGLTALVLGGIWYLHNIFDNIPTVDFDEMKIVEEQGGMLEGLRKHFSLYGLLQGIIVNMITWIWGGTWSIVHILPVMYLPMLVLFFLIFGAAACALRKKPLTDPIWLGVFILAFFEAGFLRHIFISLAIRGTGSTPGNYLHMLLPWLAPMLALGVNPLLKHRWTNILLKILSVYAVCFQLSIIWSQVALFAGCATKGDDKYYHFPDGTLCLKEAGMIADNLSVIAWPYLALASYACGMFSFGIIILKMRKIREQEN